MVTCPHCSGRLVKYGFLKKERTQRYKCKTCLKLCSDAENRTFGTLRTKPEKATLVVQLLCEGMGIRGAARVAGCHRDTVLRILRHAGKRSKELLERKLKNLRVNHVEADELHTTVLRKYRAEQGVHPHANPWGDYYIYLGIEANTKLLLLPTIGRRSEHHTEAFAKDMSESIAGRFQLTTDGFKAYNAEMKKAFGDRIDFAQLWKELHMTNAIRAKRNAKHTPKKVYSIRAGTPDKSRITTAHVERVNLSMRHFNKRFTRKSQCFSKVVEYLEHSVYLFVAHHNFCREHSSLGRKTTPAMANKLTDACWTIEKMLNKET